MEPPRLVLERPEFLLVDKPPHLLSHPTRPDGAATLLGWLQERFPSEPLALINRLDRETSGLILVARTAEAASRLGKLTMERAIHKEYQAIVWGLPDPSHGLIDQPLGRLGISEENPIWLKQGVISLPDALGRKSFSARSEYWLEESWKKDGNSSFSRVRLVAHTGRMHQLRVHLAYAGWPVVGDKIYGPDPLLYLKFIEHGWTEEHQDRLLLRRHALHAHRISFNYQGNPVTAEAPWPSDFHVLLQEQGLA